MLKKWIKNKNSFIIAFSKKLKKLKKTKTNQKYKKFSTKKWFKSSKKFKNISRHAYVGISIGLFTMLHRQVPIPVPCVNFTPIISNGFAFTLLCANNKKLVKNTDTTCISANFFKKKNG